MTLLTLGAATVPSIHSSSPAASFDSLLTSNVTTEIVKAITDKAEGFISKISLSGKEWNMFKHRDDVESKTRLEINTELSRMQHTSSLGNGIYTFLMRQPIHDRYVYRVIEFEVNGSRIDFKEQLGLVEFAHKSDERAHQSRVHESGEHIHQSRVHESDEHIHQSRVHESGEHVHQNRVHESGEHIHQSRVHESDEHIHQSRVHESDEHVHQNRVHESGEHIHQSRVHESDEHVHQNRVHESGEHIHQSRVHESDEHIHQSRVHESDEHVHQNRVHESGEHIHTHNHNTLNQPHGLVAPPTAPALATHLATLFSKGTPSGEIAKPSQAK
jgi:hypothetical protein